MIVISGGGTGGHLAIAKSLNEELVARAEKTVFIGSINGQDRMWFENDENFSDKIFLPSKGVVNKRGFGKLASLLNIIKLSFKCRKILKNNRAKAVISVGGYSAAPAAIAAIISNTPLFIHEQNAITGKLNKILKPFARGFFSSYEKPKFDYPVASRFFQSARVRSELKSIIFLGGSQGAAAINSLALNLAPALKEKNINIIHQCGKNGFSELKNQYKRLGIEVDLFEFSKDIENKMNRADLAISRAGASTLWELCANNLPTIFIPYPYAAKNHQFYNAKFLVDRNLAKFCFQKDGKVDEDEILALINSINLKEISSNLKDQINQNGAKKIIDQILS
ncbi:undecaprenyldiphospho-muramoylpentapeptide beta-N-acetylglucosaminyltransferase [Campylobacter sp.]|uniref:undecaprenyldiphospho-muramoylpentapeptide beta-N-acetylglucosaminyltransferase n=1 Tax=Campylobacter sp. TaxID=205 RepID=UPI00270BC662|nr:undecaprenyldiphospho-muramoylpentapeptide beta-N-acetylglucosaminyltransferase [Campylobacter sp.]